MESRRKEAKGTDICPMVNARLMASERLMMRNPWSIVQAADGAAMNHNRGRWPRAAAVRDIRINIRRFRRILADPNAVEEVLRMSSGSSASAGDAVMRTGVA